MFDYRPKLQIDALFFSLNDVLVDVTRSYHQTVSETVRLYMEQAIGLPKSDQLLVTPEEVICLQRIGGITDYWDLTRAFIAYFVSMLPKVPVVTFPIRLHVPSVLAYLQTASAKLDFDINTLLAEKDILQLAQQTAAVGGGLDGLYQILPDRNRHLVVASGDITRINLIGRIFQELYLGANLFEQTYEQPAIIVQNTGYQEHESLRIEPKLLEQLRTKVQLGLISTRPFHEVQYSIRRHGLKDYFQVVISRDDAESTQGKLFPDAWLLLEGARRMQPLSNQFAYVGTTLPEMAAVHAANKTVPFTSIASLLGAHDVGITRTLFENSKTSIILGNPNNLKELILD